MGYAPKFQQQITRSFDNEPDARTAQDVGYDGLDNEEERQFFSQYISQITGVVTSPQVLQNIQADPANDDYAYLLQNSIDVCL